MKDYCDVLCTLTDEQREAMNAYVDDVRRIHAEHVLKAVLEEVNAVDKIETTYESKLYEKAMVVYRAWKRAFDELWEGDGR